MADKLIVTIDRRHIRVLKEDCPPGQTTPTLSVLHAVDLMDGRGNYWDRDADQAGRFPYSKGRNNGPERTVGTWGMSIDERLPMQEEQERRIVDQIVEHLTGTLSAHPEATWSFAAGPALHQVVLEKLPPAIRQRLEHSVQKELANVPLPELREHFPSGSRRELR